MVGSFGFFLTKEPQIANDNNDKDSGFSRFIAESFRNIFRNKNILTFLFSDIDMYAVIAVISFYANYAVDLYGVSEAAAAGLFVGLIYAGQISANVVLGTLNLLSMKNKCIAGRICSISGILLIIFFPGTAVFLTASVLLGFSRAVRSLVYAPAIRQLSGKNDVTSYFAAASLLMLPLSTCIPMLCGRLLDSLPLDVGLSYKLVFGLLGLLSFLSIFFIRAVDFSAKPAAGTVSDTEA